MIELDPSLFKTPPYRHQLEGIKSLITHPAFALWDEMGSGKTAQVINAACALHRASEIDCVLVIAPASVRSVWLNETYGEIKKHAWRPSIVCEYHSQTKIVWQTGDPTDAHRLTWIVTNYEYVRPTNGQNHRSDNLAFLLNNYKRVMMVLDESSSIKSSSSSQYKAVKELRQLCARCVILNGTPISNNPLDLWAQLDVLDKNILGSHYRNFYHFRYTHCNFGGWRNKQILGWRDLDRMQAVIAPYCLRRLKRDCMDLPPKLGGLDGTPIIREVPLQQRTWSLYKHLRNEAILSLPDTPEILESNGAVRMLRLAQITSGHISRQQSGETLDPQQPLLLEPLIDIISHEKLDYTVDYLKEWSSAEASIVWCRFRPERERLAKLLRDAGITTYEIYGGQGAKEREVAKQAFLPTARGTGRRVLIAQPHAGGKGLDFSAATEAIYQSNDWSLEWRQQSEDRSHRGGTIERVTYLEILATGPNGQKTIDHTILNALRGKQNLAAWTCAAWRKALMEEADD